MRTPLSLLLLLIAGALTLPAALATWEQRVLINEDRFVSVGNKVLSEEAVQQELAKSLTKDFVSLLNTGGGLIPGVSQLTQDPLVKELSGLLGSLLGPSTGGSTAPGLGGLGIPGLGGTTPPAGGAQTPAQKAGLEGFIQPIALELVRSLPNSPVSEAALIVTHGLVVTAVRSDIVRPEEDLIVLDLSDDLEQMLPGLGLTGSVPESSDAGKIVLLKRSDLASSFRYARWFDGRAVYLIALPVVVLAAGLYIARNRGAYVAQAGLVIALSAGLWVLMAKGPVRDSSIDQALLDPSARAAATAAYDVIIETFVQQQIIVAVGGVVLLVVGLILASASRGAAQARTR